MVVDDNYHLKERIININRTIRKCEDDLKGAWFSCKEIHLENDNIIITIISAYGLRFQDDTRYDLSFMKGIYILRQLLYL